MRILELDPHPIHRIAFLNAGKRGGVVSEMLPILRGRVDELPAGLAALLLTSDLQGVVRQGPSQNILLGEALAEEYQKLGEQGLVPPLETTGVVLAGDYYSAPGGDVRGASGDVRAVWLAFARRFRWVVGVQGNHDRFGSEEQQQALSQQPNLHLLDYGCVELDGLRIGGVGGVIGDPQKPTRRSEHDFIAALGLTLEQRPDLLILHQGPQEDSSQRGYEAVAQCINSHLVPLTVCGHVHWDNPLANGPNQVLNVDSRAVLLTSSTR